MKKYGLLFMLIAGLQISLNSLQASGPEDQGTSRIENSIMESVKNSCGRQFKKLLPTNKHANSLLVFVFHEHLDKTLKIASWNILISSGKYAASWVPFSDDIFNGVKSRIPVIKDIDNKKLLMFVRSLPIIIYMLSYVDKATKRKIILIAERLKKNMQQKFKTHFKEPVFEIISEFIKENPQAFSGLLNVTQNNTYNIKNVETFNAANVNADNVNIAQVKVTVRSGKDLTPVAQAALERQQRQQQEALKQVMNNQKQQVMLTTVTEEYEDATGVDVQQIQEIQDAVNAADAAGKEDTHVTIEDTDVDALDARAKKIRKPRTKSNQVVGQPGFLSMMRNVASAFGQTVSELLTEDNSDDEKNDGDKK